MKNKIFLIIGMVLFLGCSQKTETIKYKCQPLKNKLDSLKSKSRIKQGTVVASVLLSTYPYDTKDKHLDEKIKILEMQLIECQETSL